MPPTPSKAERHGEARASDVTAALAVFIGGPNVKNRDAQIAARLREIRSAFARNQIVAVVDGYKSRHGDPSSVGGNSELTAVESAGGRRAAGDQVYDEHNAACVLLDINIKKLLDAAVAIDRQLNRIVGDPAKPTAEARLCSCCRLEPGDRETDVNGALPGARFLCLPCISFVEAQGSARVGRHGPRLPTAAEIEARRTGKAVRARVNPKASPFQWRDGSTTGTSAPLPPSAA